MPVTRKSGAALDRSKNFIPELRRRAVKKKAESVFHAASDASSGALANAVAPSRDAVPQLIEELHIHQIELELQNQELRQARTDLEISRARYFDLYDLAPVGYASIDDEGALIEMNLRAGSLLAVPRGAPPGGRKFWHYIAVEDRDTFYLCRRRLLKTGAPQSCELRMMPLTGTLFWARLEMSLGEERGARVCRIVIVDITERKTLEFSARHSESQWRQQANALPQIVWTASPAGEVDYFNERWYEYTGFSLEPFADRPWQSAVHPADLPESLKTFSRGFAAGTEFTFLCRLKRASDGAFRWHLARAVPHRDRLGAILRWSGTFTDIHEREMAKTLLETEIRHRTDALEKLQAQEDELRRLLKEKETLLKEVHHRVKNNLQVISSLLRLQGDLLKDSAAGNPFRDSERRVVCMARIHDLLSTGHSMDQIDFADYLRTLIDDLLASFQGLGPPVSARLNTAHVLLRVDQAIPCGLILNELVTNALKYAYPSGSGGEIFVDLTENAAGFVTLSVADQGVGLPAGLDWENSNSMGLPIVDLLTRQLAGTLAVHTHRGTAFTLQFRKESCLAKGQGA
jgi:PAS domain S-box-containing protein